MLTNIPDYSLIKGVSMPKKKRTLPWLPRNPEVLDVPRAAQMLTVSPDTVYDLLKRRELPGRKVGRKWLTTRGALLRWIESSLELEAITPGNQNALFRAMNKGKARVRK
jgi:excisionase family DNA binding protein